MWASGLVNPLALSLLGLMIYWLDSDRRNMMSNQITMRKRVSFGLAGSNVMLMHTHSASLNILLPA
jgi:hypothetical protein